MKYNICKISESPSLLGVWGCLKNKPQQKQKKKKKKKFL